MVRKPKVRIKRRRSRRRRGSKRNQERANFTAVAHSLSRVSIEKKKVENVEEVVQSQSVGDTLPPRQHAPFQSLLNS